MRAYLVGMTIVFAVATAAHADRALEVSALGQVAIRIDGDLREWRGAHFAVLGDVADASLEYALAYDAQALYVGARVADDEFVRTPQPSPAEDALVLTLAMPKADGRSQVSEVWLYAGVAGRQRAEAAIGVAGAAPKASAAIAIVEGPLGGHAGYVLEARVPWSAIAGGREAMLGRAALAMHDVDRRSGAKATTIATTRGDTLPPLLIEGGPHAAIAEFLRAKELTSVNVRYDLIGDVAGDARLERVVLAGSFAAVAGPEVQGGNGFHYRDLPIATAAALLDARLRDLTGDGKCELLLRMRQPTEFGTHDLFQVLGLSAGQPQTLLTIELQRSMDPILAVEVRRARGEQSVGTRVELVPEGGRQTLRISPGSVRGWDARNYPFVTEAHDAYEALLLPWNERARRYRFEGGRLRAQPAR